MTLMPTGLALLAEPSAAARLSVLPINDIQPSPSTARPRPPRRTQLCRTHLTFDSGRMERHPPDLALSPETDSCTCPEGQYSRKAKAQ